MFTCKQVSKALAEGDYENLPPLKKWLLKVHVLLCFICRGPNRNIMTFQDLVRAFRRHEEAMPPAGAMPQEVKDRLKAALREYESQ